MQVRCFISAGRRLKPAKMRSLLPFLSATSCLGTHASAYPESAVNRCETAVPRTPLRSIAGLVVRWRSISTYLHQPLLHDNLRVADDPLGTQLPHPRIGRYTAR